MIIEAIQVDMYLYSMIASNCILYEIFVLPHASFAIEYAYQGTEYKDPHKTSFAMLTLKYLAWRSHQNRLLDASVPGLVHQDQQAVLS